MKNKLVPILCFVILCSHDMYLKMDTFFLNPNQKSSINLYNGTFEKSENIIDRDRMIDVSLVGNNKRTAMEEDQWTEKDSITTLNFTTGESGTWVAGVSTKARSIEMDGAAFNKYLKHDGVTDLLESRRENGLLENSAVERYSKHVKAIFQVGDTKTDDWSTKLGYPIEFIPLSNPYESHTGDAIKVQLLREGQPLANQLVYADYKPSTNGHSHANEDSHSHDPKEAHSHDGSEEHTHGKKETHSHDGDEAHTHGEKDTHSHDGGEAHTHGENAESQGDDHEHTSGQKLRTDDNGVVTVQLTGDGFWYVRTIHLVPIKEEGFTHESNWATLTFEVQHSHDTETHSHDHDDEIPSYVYWIGSIFIIGGLFLWFSRKK